MASETSMWRVGRNIQAFFDQIMGIAKEADGMP